MFSGHEDDNDDYGKLAEINNQESQSRHVNNDSMFSLYRNSQDSSSLMSPPKSMVFGHGDSSSLMFTNSFGYDSVGSVNDGVSWSYPAGTMMMNSPFGLFPHQQQRHEIFPTANRPATPARPASRLYARCERPAMPSSHTLYGAAKRLEFNGNFPAAIEFYMKSISVGERAESAVKDIAGILNQLGRTNEAVEFMRRHVHLALLNPGSYYNLLSR
jgi:hypothetical protein